MVVDNVDLGSPLRPLKWAGGIAEESGLPELLLSEILALPYGELAGTVCTLLQRMNYHSMRLMGRSGFFGRSERGGADVGGRLAAGKGDDTVVVQVKQYESASVRARMVDELRGVALREQAAQGILVTTSRCSPAALASAKRGGHPRVTCIDGPLLAELCIAHRVGVKEQQVSALVLDRQFFAERRALPQ